MALLYLDTNVFLSMWLDEIGAGMPIPFGYYSARLFEEALSCKHVLATSKIAALEVNEKFPFLLETMRDEISNLKEVGKIHIFEFDMNIQGSAVETNRALSKHGLNIGWKDCIHILTAKQNNATLVTWDKGMQEACRILGVKVTDPQALNL